MKTIKTLLSATALVAIFSMGAFAQNNASVAVTANAVAPLTVTNVADVAFGTISTGSASTIKANANDVAVESNLGITAAAGQVSIAGPAGANNVNIQFGTATLVLENTPATTVTFTPTVYFGANEVTSGSNISLTAGTDLLDIGGVLGSITTNGNYATGGANFTGGTPLVITVEYN